MNKGTQRGFGRREGQPFINREHRTDVPNSITAYSITPDDRYVACIGTSALQPVYTLPPAALCRKGSQLVIFDDVGVLNPFTGGFSISLKVQTNPYANDTINGGTVPIVITVKYGFVVLTPDGVSEWTILDQSEDIQYFTGTASATWTKRPGYTTAYVMMVGAGGAGGSGAKQASGTSAGGAGGGSGGVFDFWISLAALNATETVVAPTGPNGGAAVSANTTNGNAGGARPANTSITIGGAAGNAIAQAGNPGAGGTTAATAATAAIQQTDWRSTVGGGAGQITATGGAGPQATFGAGAWTPGGGGGGGGGSALPTTGGNGGNTLVDLPNAAGTVGGTGIGPAPAGHSAPTGAFGLRVGSGGAGGGGGTNAGVVGCGGGDGGFPGGGGGGGGGGVTASSNSGKGGKAGDAVCVVVSMR